MLGERTTEHMIECRNKDKEIEERIKLQWLKETEDLNIIRKVNKWMEKEVEFNKEREQE